ncbi:hypothetical protein CKO38_14765 [Rhodospirillum rubrum]|uniref:phage tail terminator-like protein n=1 Tax=Rhodospirillum rubrum TaxID=1085 RepID=UPI001907666B|nr:phage tail terminator-like protein [Rhodospirillum rubrum]MBK1666303.1 hypothetical protein [Rhodospirillum rubrum]MBK1677909.1 hypothetical protein [Rhodospirillum rubrum]
MTVLRALLEARLRAVSPLPVVFENREARPPPGRPFVLARFAPMTAAGDATLREETGTLRLCLHLPLGQGATAAEAATEAFDAGLSGRQMGAATAVVATGVLLRGGGQGAGAFWTVSLDLPYHALAWR